MKTLVIGGSGFVGHAIVRALLGAGWDVAVLNRGSRLIPNTWQLVADRNDDQSLRRALNDCRFDAVVDTNCYFPSQAQSVVDAIGGRTGRVVMISSAAVYADGVTEIPDESEPIGGAKVWGGYGREKAASEQLYKSFADRFDDFVAVRPPYVFGRNNNLDRERWFWRRLLHQRPVLVPGSGDAALQFLHEDDLGEAVTMLLHRPASTSPRALNVADPRIVRSGELSGLLADIAGVPDTAVVAGKAAGRRAARDWFPFRDTSCAVNPRRMINTIGWRPQKPLEQWFEADFSQVESALRQSPDDWTPVEQEILDRMK